MSRHQALQDRLLAIEAQLAVPAPAAPGAQPLPRRPGSMRHDAADQVSPVLQQLLAEVLPGAMVLDWRQEGAGHAGRMAADGLVFRFRVDAAGVGYRPAWDGVLERGWEIRSDSFLQLRAPELRMDFRGSPPASGQKRKCKTGYSCGSTCISLQKECRISPGSALGKARLRRLQQLAAAGDRGAQATAEQVQASRGAAAAARQKERNTKRVEQLLARPEIAEFLRTGKLPVGTNSSTEPGTVREMKPGEIAFDPSRFQYKLNATATTGEVGSLSGVRKWDANLSGVMSVWKDPGDGKVYVINGHNRLALANRLGAEAVTVRFLNAANATEARAIGALQNIAEGAGSPMDAAKFFRDTGIKSQADVEARGLPLGSGQADKGLKLSRLPGDVFNAVVRGDLTVNRGAIIGGSGLEEAKQREVFKMISSRKGIADQTLQELVEHAAASQQRTQTTMSLFGETQEAKDNLITRAKLSAGLKAKISREKRLFGAVSKARAATTLQQKGGNVINQAQSAKVAGEASEALGVFERLKSSAGPISSALNRAADRVEAGEAEATVRKELERDVFQAVQAELEAVGLRKRPRADSLETRIDALKRKCQTGYGCGSACISLRKECRSQPGSAVGKERMRRLLDLAAGGASSQRGIAPVKAGEAGKLAEGIASQRGLQAAQLRGARAQQKPAKAQTLEQEISRLRKLQMAHEESSNRSGHHPGTLAREVIAGLQALNNSSDYGSKKPGKPLRWNIHGKNHEIPESKLQGLSPRQVSALIYSKVSGYKEPNRFQAFGGWFVVPNGQKPQTAGKPPVLTNPGRQDPGLHPARRGQQAAQLRGARAQQKGTKTGSSPAGRRSADPVLDPDEVHYLQVSTKSKFASDRKTRDELIRRGVDLGSDPQKRLQQLGSSVRKKLLGDDYYTDPDYRMKLRSFAKASEAVTVTATTVGRSTPVAGPPSVLTNPRRQDPGLAPKPQEQGLNAKDVVTSSQQAAFARQQQQAARAAGDQSGAQAWRKEERAVERGRLATAISSSKQSQSSLFGVAEYDETLPLFQQQSGGQGGEDPTLGGGRPRRRLGGSRRRDGAAESLAARIDALRRQCATMS